MTNEKFETYLIEDWTWRKKEISELILIAEKEESQAVLKSIILLLYSHWEGYIKKSCRFYLKYICDNKYKISELTANFKAFLLKGINAEIDKSGKSYNLSNELTYLKLFMELDNINLGKKMIIDIENEKDKGYINTHDNLNPQVFKSILECIGIEYKNNYEIKAKYIEIVLLTNRNSIGHGSTKIFNDEDFEFKIESLKKLRDIISIIIESLRDELIEFVNKELFLKVNSSKINEISAKYNDLLIKEFSKVDDIYKN
ncbi:MAE_28990/MAE_18760 family HEPN-like nuclease [Empedobacter brevis]